MSEVLELGKKAKKASVKLANISTEIKNRALRAMADALITNTKEIIEINKKDLEEGKKRNFTKALIDRLLLNEARIEDMAKGLREVAFLKDPVGEIIKGWKLPNELEILQVRVPLGVIGIIYEARPNVTVDAAGLCVKSGNAVILRGGSVAINSNLILTNILADAGVKEGLPENSIQSVLTTDRAAVTELMKMHDYVDVLIPRGGASLIQSVIENSTVPVIKTGLGNCHIYVDKLANLSMAEKIVINAKCQRPGVCNAAETLLVHKDVAKIFLPKILKELQERNVEVFGCPVTCSVYPGVNKATEEDWKTEYLDLKMAVKVMESLDEAILHIQKYGTNHSEAIVTEDYSAAKRFTEEVDAAAVYVNASTRFTDGGEYGLGAEVGISTQKLHARGPMGLQALTSTKYVVYGEGQVRS
ncbi:glutamate-5-semialdehyde dehydrogenase [Candidatus Oleimmundimicrobium sp.]|uniref:glutamate-5-semialdehyde dehydrogenase n=1 Tax=Candidatus Oleimmundimicrobium sp. TaxID=3060597 RepID=UPI00271DD345|nr:glutamate-5-semialdehyde dehydrogenase [Candidatus Oleimmundimicrobium sp.]MDO8886150.1 glutamate-5-semialdehyde dehydrogenase [Candidatus Oleimmundimicrobium sp.]